jgi:hypothetical protein
MLVTTQRNFFLLVTENHKGCCTRSFITLFKITSSCVQVTVSKKTTFLEHIVNSCDHYSESKLWSKILMSDLKSLNICSKHASCEVIEASKDLKVKNNGSINNDSGKFDGFFNWRVRGDVDVFTHRFSGKKRCSALSLRRHFICHSVLSLVFALDVTNKDSWSHNTSLERLRKQLSSFSWFTSSFLLSSWERQIKKEMALCTVVSLCVYWT